MGETVNIAQMAEKVSDEIFSWLKWDRRPHTNNNWDCVIDEHKNKTHPSDVVFSYHHPYLNRRKYLNVDVKSYAKNSINSTTIGSALSSLAKAVSCANLSPGWKNLFAIHSDYEVDGLLFVYNHDGGYDKSFRSHFKGIDKGSLEISHPRVIHVMGPETISIVVDIISDIRFLVSEEVIPNKSSYTFYYPDMFKFKRSGDEWKAPALPEYLNSPWLIIKHKLAESYDYGYVIYYNRSGDSTMEFIYLLDYLSHNQILLGDSEIRIRFTRPGNNAAANFEKAQHFYLSTWGVDEEREKKIFRIRHKSLTKFSTGFSEIEIGMGLE